MSAWRGMGAFAAALLVCLAFCPAGVQAQTIYGFEDGLGMLHTSTRRVDARYQELCTLRPGEKKPDHAVLVSALREKNAILDTIPPGAGDLVAGLDVRGAAILRAAEGFIGAPYLFGGDTPAGVDCSGLTKAVYQRLGATLPRHSAHQAAMGAAVERDMLLPGDLVFFSTDRTAGINHVGIFLGGGRMLHSSSRSAGVRVERMDAPDYARWYVTARRIAAPPAAPPSSPAEAKAVSATASGGERRVSAATEPNASKANL
ncbi:C40 family peptidase [Desulfovibrio sulfodismutans]|uniref:C40 family peptidase n=1 Tax=Desulfolutivibrio sulfodismutans TaxID=63561 RepID=A0A7K3NPF9_9BACT|nr:C40 family peptidase [Desulfolutivibrio sulfodismutans]NDY57723.1 C40 family peptidase [Desulfolutivibrio sulfodismutans]